MQDDDEYGGDDNEMNSHQRRDQYAVINEQREKGKCIYNDAAHDGDRRTRHVADKYMKKLRKSLMLAMTLRVSKKQRLTTMLIDNDVDDVDVDDFDG